MPVTTEPSVTGEPPAPSTFPSPVLVTQLIGFAQAARAMATATNVDEGLRGVVTQTALTFAGVGVSLVMAGRGCAPGTTKVSQPEVGQVEALQLTCAEGPTYWVLQQGVGILSDDVRFDSRWRFWGPQAAELGFRSFASVPVWDGAVRGVLTVYATHPSAFNTDDLVLLEVYAVHVCVALAGARERRTSHEQGQIARAEGILMERYHISQLKAGDALRLHALRHQSDAPNVASQLVDQWTLATTPPLASAIGVPTPPPSVAVAPPNRSRLAFLARVKARAQHTVLGEGGAAVATSEL